MPRRARRGPSALGRHPEHDRLVVEVRNWYTASDPRTGYHVEPRRYGFYARNRQDGTNRVIVDGLSPADVKPFLDDLRIYYGGQPVRIHIDDAEADRRLGKTLVDAGCSPRHALVYLAHVGAVAHLPAVPGMSVEAVTGATLREFIATRIKGFADSEDEPPASQVDEESRHRLAAMATGSQFFIARIEGIPAGVVGWEEGRDRFVFQLATRLPFRGRGIATAILCQILDGAYARGCVSVVINADAAGLAVHLYRRLGFLDEVYWRRGYRFEPA